MENKELFELAGKRPYSLSELSYLLYEYNLSIDELKFVTKIGDKCGVSFKELSASLKRVKDSLKD